MNRLFIIVFVFVTSLALGASAADSGPEWGEDGDAGSLPPGQTTFGNGSLLHISGCLGTVPEDGGIDFEDMYLIQITIPELFRATTDEDDPEIFGGFAKFDSQLWLFQPLPAGDKLALGLLGNDNAPITGSFQSLLVPLPTDGTPTLLVDPGLYFIAITRAVSPVNNNPISPAGLIFNLASPTEISGPDGPGGSDPIIGWSGDEGMFNGLYSIALRGAAFAESSCPWDLDGSGSVGTADLLELFAQWGTAGPADFDESGVVNTADLLILFANWGPCP